MPLLRNIDRSKISKRKNPVSLVYYRDSGYLPEATLNFLGLMGGGMPNAEGKEADIFSLPRMIAEFRFEKISLGGPVFDLTKLKWLDGEYLRALSPEAFFRAVRETVFGDVYLRQISATMQTRIETLGQFGDLTGFFFADNVMPPLELFLPKKRTIEETLAFAAEMLTTLESSDWTSLALDPALKNLAEQKGWSVKETFMLLRAILTGSTASPPLLESLVIFGKARSVDRVRRFLEAQKRTAGTKK